MDINGYADSEGNVLEYFGKYTVSGMRGYVWENEDDKVYFKKDDSLNKKNFRVIKEDETIISGLQIKCSELEKISESDYQNIQKRNNKVILV